MYVYTFVLTHMNGWFLWQMSDKYTVHPMDPMDTIMIQPKENKWHVGGDYHVRWKGSSLCSNMNHLKLLGGSSQDLFQWLGSPLFTNHLGHLEGKQPYLWDLLTMVTYHVLTGMILQVVAIFGESSVWIRFQEFGFYKTRKDIGWM